MRLLLPCLRLPLLVIALLLCSSAALAQSRGEEEARRQLEFAKQEVVEGNYEKALTSADSALRLFPALYEAYVYKALAYEGLGKLKMAESFLLTYKELRPGGDQDPTADEALARIQDKLGRSDEPEADPGGASSGNTEAGGSAGTLDPVDLEGMPALPSGSEEFLSWLVLKQQVDTLEARRDIGGGLTAGGLALVGVGAGLMVAMSVVSSDNPNDANVEAVYAAGVGSIMAGGTLTVIGLPTLASAQSKLGKLKASTATASRPAPELRLAGAGFDLRF